MKRSDIRNTITARAYPVSDAPFSPRTVTSGRGLPYPGRVRLTKLAQKDEKKKKVRVGTLNLGTMNGKGREIVDMMQKRRVDVLCIQETRWKGNKAKQLEEGYKIYYSGADARGRNGVGVILKRELVDNVCEVNRRNDRIMTMKLEVEGCPTRIVCVYAPQQGCEEEEKDNFWQELDQVMMEIPKEERIIAGGDFNGHVGRRGNDEERVHGGWSYGERNDGGELMILMKNITVQMYFFRKDRQK
ncbi:hypothetical protein M8J77_024198 [Diaphorina citri]|nr:hypothetical protein M8J77_024198 [Diaphorina citri]